MGVFVPNELLKSFVFNRRTQKRKSNGDMMGNLVSLSQLFARLCYEPVVDKTIVASRVPLGKSVMADYCGSAWAQHIPVILSFLIAHVVREMLKYVSFF